MPWWDSNLGLLFLGRMICPLRHAVRLGKSHELCTLNSLRKKMITCITYFALNELYAFVYRTKWPQNICKASRRLLKVAR
jgi:hypothetical protein